MSLHFSANQFDREFTAKRLGNWEVPKWFPDRPRQHDHKTRIIADDRGHLLPGVPRYSEKPWEKYITAWDFPRKITRKFAQEVTDPPSWKVAAWSRQPQESRAPPQGGKGEPEDSAPEEALPYPSPCYRKAAAGRDDEARQQSPAVTERSGKEEEDASLPSPVESRDREGEPRRSPPAAGAEGPPSPAASSKGRRSPKSRGSKDLLEAPAEEDRSSPPPGTPPSQASEEVVAPPEAQGDSCKNCGKKIKSQQICPYQLDQEKLNRYKEKPC